MHISTDSSSKTSGFNEISSKEMARILTTWHEITFTFGTIEENYKKDTVAHLVKAGLPVDCTKEASSTCLQESPDTDRGLCKTIFGLDICAGINTSTRMFTI